MGGQIKLRNNEAFELSGCLARLAQSKVFQDLKIVCQVLCIYVVWQRHSDIFWEISWSLGMNIVQPNASLLLAAYVQYTHAILSITDVKDNIYAKHSQYPILESTLGEISSDLYRT